MFHKVNSFNIYFNFLPIYNIYLFRAKKKCLKVEKKLKNSKGRAKHKLIKNENKAEQEIVINDKECEDFEEDEFKEIEENKEVLILTVLKIIYGKWYEF